jgi:hypothetical protein
MRAITLSLVAALALAVPCAAAQDNTAFAQQRFTRGSGLYEQRSFGPALDEFRASLALYGSPNTRLYVARCLRELGRLDEALPEFERAMREAADRAPTDPRYNATRDAAQTEMLAIEPRVGRLTLTIPDAPAGVVVRVNNREIPREALGVPMAVMPGAVTIAVESAEHEPERRESAVAAGREVTVGIVLRRRPTRTDGQTELQRPPPVAVTPAPRGGVSRNLAWIGFGLGAAGFIGFGAFGAVASGTFSDLQLRCGNTACPESERAEIDRGRTMQTLANVSLGVGIAGAIAGTVLWIVGRGPERAPAAAPRVTAYLGDRSLGVAGVF